MGEITVSALDQKLISKMFLAFGALRHNGWQDIAYAPCDTPLEFIVPGSTGVFRGEKSSGSEEQLPEGFWLFYGGDAEFCHPILFRRSPA